LKNVPQQTDEHYESTLKKAEKTKKLVLQTYFIHLFLCVTFLFFFE